MGHLYERKATAAVISPTHYQFQELTLRGVVFLTLTDYMNLHYEITVVPICMVHFLSFINICQFILEISMINGDENFTLP